MEKWLQRHKWQRPANDSVIGGYTTINQHPSVQQSATGGHA